MNALASYWQSRSAGERTALGAAGLLALALLLVAFAWLPMERARARLAAGIPRLEASLAVMERQALEVKRLRTLAASTPATQLPLPGLAASGALTRALPGAQAAALDERRLRLTLADAPFAALLEACSGALTQYGLRVESARIEALPAAGRVRADITFTRS